MLGKNSELIWSSLELWNWKFGQNWLSKRINQNFLSFWPPTWDIRLYMGSTKHKDQAHVVRIAFWSVSDENTFSSFCWDIDLWAHLWLSIILRSVWLNFGVDWLSKMRHRRMKTCFHTSKCVLMMKTNFLPVWQLTLFNTNWW